MLASDWSSWQQIYLNLNKLLIRKIRQHQIKLASFPTLSRIPKSLINQDDNLLQRLPKGVARGVEAHRQRHRRSRKRYFSRWWVNCYVRKAFPSKSLAAAWEIFLTKFSSLLGHRMWEHRGEPSCIPWIAVHHRRRSLHQRLRSHLVPRNCLPKGCWWNLVHWHPQEEGNHSRNQGRQRCRWFDGIRG